MEYIISKGINGVYVQFDKTSKLTLTTAIGNAAVFSYDKANAILNNQIRPTDRHLYHIIELATECSITESKACSPTIFDDANFNWKGTCEYIQQFLGQLPQYKINLDFAQKQIEAEKIDLEHYIEFTKMNASQGYQAFKMLQEIMKRRRHIKDEMTIVRGIMDCDLEQLKNGRPRSIIDGLEKRLYTPRKLINLFEK